MTANDIKLEIERKLNPEKVEEMEQKQRSKNLFAARYLKFTESKIGSTSPHLYGNIQAYV